MNQSISSYILRAGKGVGSLLLLTGIAGGCAGRASLLPNSDPALRKTSAEFAASSAKRHYEADAPRGGDAVARASIEYTFKRVDLVNLSDEEWDNVEVWINHQYVVFVPKIAPKVTKNLHFQMFYDDNGTCYSTNESGKKVWVNDLEIFRDGKIYTIPKSLP